MNDETRNLDEELDALRVSIKHWHRSGRNLFNMRGDGSPLIRRAKVLEGLLRALTPDPKPTGDTET